MFASTTSESKSPNSTIYTSSTIYNSFPVQLSQRCRPFKYHEILSATENFDESLVIGRGSFGKVYKGNLDNEASHVEAAIKRMDSKSLHGRSNEFWAEVEILSKVRNTRLVPLIGYCDYEQERLLVYLYMPNGTLYNHLHRLSTPLSWLQRLKICVGVALALDYLHTGASIDFTIIHGDVKSDNILLNESWAPKLTDFGFSKIVPRDQELTNFVKTHIKGTFGYLDPHYLSSGMLSMKSDVYSFGVVLFEVLCQKRAVDKSLGEERWGLATWAQDSIKDGRLKNIIDSDIRDEISSKFLKGFVQIAERCLDVIPEHRPTIAKVLATLESVLNLQEKTNNALQATGKSITTNDKNSGVEFELRIPKKRNLLRLREKILQQTGAMSSKRVSLIILQLKPNYFGSIKIFGAKELAKATNNYAKDRILGRGAQGIVYKGILPDKRAVAIKSQRILGQTRLEQLLTEIVILEKVIHKNVVKLLGCCFETEGALLVYEFISKGTLDHFLHNGTSSMATLSWDKRLKIAHESANALAYLHTHEAFSVVHRDVKCANILLDENYTAKISDFGSSRLIPLNHGQITTEVGGTFGYMDPEYYDTCQLTCKIDVYGFGVVLAELLTAKKPFDKERGEDDIRLSTYFVNKTKDSQLLEIVDPQVLEEATDEQLNAAGDLVYGCLEQLGVDRPSMKEVTVELERIRRLGKHPWVS